MKAWFVCYMHTGILVQLPLPKHINEEKVLSEISLEKDVDGFHPLNVGKLAMKGRDPLFLPCTPKAITYILLNLKYIRMGLVTSTNK